MIKDFTAKANRSPQNHIVFFQTIDKPVDIYSIHPINRNASWKLPGLGLLFVCGITFFMTVISFCAEPIRIGAIFSKTGIAAVHNEPQISMVQLAVADINNTGGVLTRQVQLILLDNQSTPIGAATAAKKAVQLNVTAVIGAHWSSHSLAMAPVLQQAKIPMISPGSTNPDVTKIGDYIFRTCFLDSFQGMAMARFSYNDLAARTAVVVQNIDEKDSLMPAQFFKNSFVKMGGQVALDAEYRGKAVNFADIIEQIQSLHPDVIYIPGYTRDSGLFIKQARDMGIKAVFLGGDAWDEIQTIAGDAINGSYQSAPWHPEVPFLKSHYLQKLYQLKYHHPITNMSSPLAYDAVHLLINAIKKAGSTDKTAIRDALAQTMAFKGATGIISFDKNGDPKNKDIIILQFKNSRPVYHKTITSGF
ncbi:MAG: ABC transporter substrate-binding protein [Pseudomonadota bacterium]